MNKKGYIGAIGDDLPSLIPIFLGITIFFGVFLSTYNVYRNNTDLYSLKNDAINISAILKEEPLYSDYNSFIKTCGKINTKYNWSAFVLKLDLNTSNYVLINPNDIEGIENQLVLDWENQDNKFTCGLDIDSFAAARNLNKDIIIYRFPVTVQRQFYSEPAWLFVTIWR